MRRSIYLTSSLFIAFLFNCCLSLSANDSNLKRVVAERATPRLQFEANQGQSRSEVKFLAHAGGYTLWLTSNSAFLSLQSTNGADHPRQVIGMQLLKGNPRVQVTGEEIQPGVSNYLIGSSSSWKTGISNYARVRYLEIYKGIDLVYHGEGQTLEYDFVIKPGADLEQVRYKVVAEDNVHLNINKEGDLSIEGPAGQVVWKRPVAYQQDNEVRKFIPAKYRLVGDNVIAFEVAEYDHSQRLVVDPSLVYAGTGGPVNGALHGARIAVDRAGSAYIVGSTEDPTYPATPGAYQTSGPLEPFQGGAGQNGHNAIFVIKLAPDGYHYVYSTFISGTPTKCTTPKNVNGYIFGAVGEAIAIDARGNAFVAGWTDDQDFPVTPQAYQKKLADPCAENNVVVKLNSTGSALVYSTYLGGTFGDNPYALVIDSGGNAYITGTTGSADYPTTAGTLQPGCTPPSYAPNNCFEAFVSKLNSTGSALVYSTYLGSPTGSGSNWSNGIAVDSSGNAYVVGATFANDMPLANAFQTTYMGGYDSYIAKLNPTGSALVYATYLGGTQDDVIDAVAVDAFGSAFVTGYTLSSDFPIQNAFQRQLGGGFYDAFVTKLSPSGNSLVYSTYLGGSAQAEGRSIVVNSNDQAIVAGYDHASDYPVTQDAYQKTFISDPSCEEFGFPGCSDAFLTVFSSHGKPLVYSTFYGGPNTEAWGVALDPAQNVYISGVTSASANCSSLYCFSPGTAVTFWAKFSAMPAVP
ncbi:MAG: cell surface glycoprotein (s-layer protein) related protein [Acidobacteriaceae bacterium]|nr:cell surface glycoprotein (s-layer protein) related protein [Acidobacteriaceae bacterium]